MSELTVIKGEGLATAIKVDCKAFHYVKSGCNGGVNLFYGGYLHAE